MRDKFRPNLSINDIHQIKDHNPDYEYRNVIFTYRHDPRNVDRHLERGWEIVLTTDILVDDRSFTPNSKEKKLRPQECITKTMDKHEQVLMRILKTRRAENEIKDKEQRDTLLMTESRKRGDKVVKKGNHIITKGAELNEGSSDINFNEL